MMKKTIMVIDDEQAVCRLVEDIFKQAYRIIKAQSAAQALKILKKTIPDLILLDHFMPKITGMELCEKIRADSKLKNIKIAFFTVARFSKNDIEKLKQMNVLDYIQKPFDSEDLIRRVKKIIG